MSLMFWEEKYSVKVKEIDDQHKKLFGMINDLQRAMAGGQGVDILQRTFEDMTDYAATHFRTEERYFEEFSFPESAAHCQEHRFYEDRLQEFKRGLAENSDLSVYTRYLGTDVMKFLREWWLNHIAGTDKKYSQCFNAHGLL